MNPHRVLLTGAAGEIGTALREQLRGRFPVMRLTDVRDMPEARPGEEVMPADLTDLASVQAVMQDVDAVIHLGGIANEHTYEQIRNVNMDGTYHVLEAAQRAGVKRVAFASSIHTVGHYARTETISPAVPVRLYWERYGLEFVGVRICSFQARPQDRRHLSTWLSPRDAAQLFEKAVTAPDVGYLIVAGISGNARRWMSPEGWDLLGYDPQDDAETYAAEVASIHGDPAVLTEQRQGGVFVDPTYVGLAGK